MLFSEFLIIVAVIYAAYYSINILIDVFAGRAPTSSAEEGNIQFDLGEESLPRKATLNDSEVRFEPAEGGQKREIENQGEETFNESYANRYYGKLGVDLRLEDVLPPEVDLHCERLRKNGQHY